MKNQSNCRFLLKIPMFLTPMDYRKKVYQDLREQARTDLQQDKKLLLLQKSLMRSWISKVFDQSKTHFSKFNFIKERIWRLALFLLLLMTLHRFLMMSP